MPTEHIVALFDRESSAVEAAREIEAAGIPAAAIRHYKTSTTDNRTTAAPASGSLEATHSTGGFWSWLFGEDHSETTRAAYPRDEDIYERHARAGNTVLGVMVDNEALIHQVISILESHHPVQIEEDTQEGGVLPSGITRDETAGTTSVAASRTDYSTSDVARPAPPDGGAISGTTASSTSSVPGGRIGADGAEEVIPLTEEKLEIGKRTVDRGTTRVRRYVVEKPVERDVTLHGERVTIERRRPVDGTEVSPGGFEERIVEVTETEEVPVVAKQAQVVEEVAIRREATERTETVRDTVRREEVEVSGNDTGLRSPSIP